MKVNDIIEEFADCVGEQTREIFYKSYSDIDGVISVQFEELLEMMDNAKAEQNDINFQKEEEILNRLSQIKDEENIYILNDENLQERLAKLFEMIDNDGNIMTRVTAIQEFVRLLGKHTITESEWEDSDEGQDAMQQAQDVCNEPSNSYDNANVRDSDFY